MRVAVLLLSLAVATIAALVPPASAGACTGPTASCPGIVCVWNSVGPGGTGARICVNAPGTSVAIPGGVCSEATQPDQCWGEFACVGYSTNGHYYSCKYGIEDPCHTTVTCVQPDGAFIALP